MAINTAGSAVTRQQLDAYLIQVSLALKTSFAMAAQLSQVLSGIDNNDLTNLDPAKPYTADEVFAIGTFANQLGTAAGAMNTGADMPAVTTSLATLWDRFIGLTN